MQFCSFLKLFVRLFFIFLCALGARNIVDSQKSFIERSSGKHKKLIVTSSTPGTWIIGGGPVQTCAYSLCNTLYNKLLFLLRIKHIIKKLPVINAGTLKTQRSTNYRVEGGLAKLKSINWPCPICGPIRDT